MYTGIPGEGQDSTHLIDNVKENEPMEENRILKLTEEVEFYKQAIQDAKDALASAEQELDEVLAYEYENQ